VAKSTKNARSVGLRSKVQRPAIDPAIDAAEARQAKTDEFRTWLREVVEGTGKSLHAIEVEAGIYGNGLGKFLRGERGQRHSLTPLLIGRLAPVISVGEEEMLVRAGHLSYDPGDPPIEAAIIADRALDSQAKALLLGLLGRLREREEPR
jgi:hypothetical protein